MSRILASIALATCICGGRPAAWAKSVQTVDYPLGNVWSTTIRFLRVDRGYRITDKDRETGYILFVYPGKGAVKHCAASLELISVREDEQQRIRMQLNIDHQASYVEVDLLEQIAKKLRDELGPPREPSRKKEPPADKPPAGKAKKTH
ncbi:MAG: hypothetical protein H6707_08370 [Deltaproteobacteria bacterium]|nr:hypothetical protein [Deltaproteobacteria bacterium]